MKILTIKTDQPEAYLAIWNNRQLLLENKWLADKQLSDDIHRQILSLLKDAGTSFEGLNGLIFFQGPGSFTGLRISASVFNALAYSLDIPIVGCSGEKWQEKGIDKLLNGANDKIAVPIYGGKINITKPKK